MVSSVAILAQATTCAVSRCVLFSPCTDGRAPCGGAPWAPAAPCQLQAALPGLGVAARDLLRSNVLPGKVAKRLELLDAAYSVCRHITLAYSNTLYDEVNTCWRKHDHSEPQSRDHDHMQKIEKSLNFQKWILRIFLFLEPTQRQLLWSTLVLFSMQLQLLLSNTWYQQHLHPVQHRHQ